MNNHDLFMAARFTRSTIIDDMDYPTLLKNRHDTWQRRCKERGLDPEQQREAGIRRSIEQQKQRSGRDDTPRRTWLRRFLDALR